MTPWTIEFTAKAEKDIDSLDHTQRIQVNKVILKVSKNPLSKNENGYGEWETVRSKTGKRKNILINK